MDHLEYAEHCEQHAQFARDLAVYFRSINETGMARSCDLDAEHWDYMASVHRKRGES